MTVNLLLLPTPQEADAAFISMQPDSAHALSGSNSICVITATARCNEGKCESVSLEMIPSFC
jgi:proline racemase